MPRYDYLCGGCGRFSATRPLNEFDRPAPCPVCGAAAPRALTAPAVLGRSARRQTSQGEPGGYRRLRHPAFCACCPR